MKKLNEDNQTSSLNVNFFIIVFIFFSYCPFLNAQLQHPPVKAASSNVDATKVKLNEALALYYNRQYRLALPIFQAIAQNDDSTPVLFWLGRSAFETGQYDLAIEKYKTILGREPKLSRVRLELAASYLKNGNKDAAKVELQKIKDESKAPAIAQQIEQAITSVESKPLQQEQAGNRFFAALRASIGPEYDSNVNVGPRDERILLANNQSLISRNLDGWLLKFNVNGDALYDFGDRDGFVWHSRLQFLHQEYPDKVNDEFNYTQTDANSGLDYYGKNFVARLPFGFIDRRFSNKPLSRSYYFVPNIEYNLTDNLSFAASYRYENEDFIGSVYDVLSNVTHTGSFGPQYKFQTANAQHSLALLGSYSRRDANSKRFSYDEWSLGPSYFVHFNYGTELYLDFKYFNRDYDAPALFFEGKGNRRDNRYSMTFALSQTFYKHYFVSLSYSYTDNASNAKLFDYDKNMVGLNFGTNLSF